jgi:hypothetical protein
MAASYPSSIRVFTTKTNVTDVVEASHPNSVQEEVVAIQSTLGASPQVSTAPSSGGAFTATSFSYSSVTARLANIETGVVSDAHIQYLRKAGDTTNVITIGASTTKGLVIKGAASQSANLQEWQNTGGTVLSSIDSAGNHAATSFVKTSGTSSQFLKADGSVDSSTYLTTGTASSTYLTSATAATTYQAKFVVNATAKTAAYTLAAGDYETMVQMNGAFAFSLTTALSGAAVGTQIHLLALTTGVSVSATGVTLNGTPGLKLRAAYSSATLICLASNNWVLIGDLSA